MKTTDFDYELPEELIAQTPIEPRDHARLMVLDRGAHSIAHRHFYDLPAFLREGDLLVINDTRVMAGRLHGERLDTGGQVEVLLLREVAPRRWAALMRPARQAVPGRTLRFRTSDGDVDAEVLGRDGQTAVLQFMREIDADSAGDVPLPPYIHAPLDERERYQTVYARELGSAAAPTAGLHFTPGLFERLGEAGVGVATVTLHIGPGTFLPVRSDDPREHPMHAEYITVPEDSARAIVAAKAGGRRVVAVGTTVVRTLEHVAAERGRIESYAGWTNLLILPGYEFRAIDALITNFHLPKSTLLMLVSAFADREFMLDAYRTAVEERYRFYSFGDAMLIL